jgi:hypothetical protein
VARFFVLCMCLCVVVAVVAILRIPDADFFRTFVNNRMAETQPGDAPAENDSAGVSAGASGPSATRPSGELSAGANVSNLEGSRDRPDPQLMKVLGDSVPVYSSNSPDGDVLRRFEKGDQVEPGLQVLSPDGWWMEVRVDPQTSGFMLSENLGP